MFKFKRAKNSVVAWMRGRDHRYQRAAWTSMVMLISRGLSVLGSLATLPFVARYLGGELFGLWLLVTNLVAVLVFADLGVAIGFQNQLIRCFAADDRESPSKWLANAIVVMVTMALSIVLIAWLMLPLIPFDLIVESNEARRWVAASLMSLAASFAIGLPAMLLEYVGNAYQRGYWTHGLIAIGRLVSLLAVAVACSVEASVPVLVALFVAIPHCVSLLGFPVLWWKVPWLRPDFKGVSIDKTRQLLQVGAGVLGLRITHTMSMQGPTWLTAYVFGLTDAGLVAFLQKLLAIPLLLTQTMNGSIQGALGEAAAKGQWDWVRSNLLRLVRVVCIAFAINTVLAIAIGGEPFVLMLDGKVPAPSRIVMLLLCLYTGMFCIRNVFGVFLMVVDRVFYQPLYRIVPLLSTFAIAHFFRPDLSVLCASFVLISELPQMLCTLFEARLVIGRGLRNCRTENRLEIGALPGDAKPLSM